MELLLPAIVVEIVLIKGHEMTNRERVLAVLRYGEYDRLPVAHFGFWSETLQKWALEGHISASEAQSWGDGNPTDAAISAKLPPGRFLRISPFALVNVGQIKGLRRLCQSEWAVLLRNGTRLTLTRGYGEHLRRAGWFTIAARRPLVWWRFTVRRPGRN